MTEPRLSTPKVQTELPPSDDPLAVPLRLLKMTGVLHCRAELTAPWGLGIPRIPDCIAMHIVTGGSCYLQIAGQPTIAVEENSVVMIPHGTEHELRSSPDAKVTPLTDVPVELLTDRYERMVFGGGGEVTNISYCGVRFDPVGAQRLLQVLPLVIHLDNLADADQWLFDTVQFISREADATRPGSEAVITRLADVAVVQAIRAWLGRAEGRNGWLAALQDKQIGRALAIMHRDPAQHWSVVTLAREVGMSRSGLASRFSELIGESVMQYLMEVRMQLARVELMESDQSLGAVAEKYGYQSESAFSRAFKRVIGKAPGKVRRDGS